MIKIPARYCEKLAINTLKTFDIGYTVLKGMPPKTFMQSPDFEANNKNRFVISN